MRRRTVLTAAAATALAAPVLGATPALASSASSSASGTARHGLEIRGCDISSLPKDEDRGAVYRYPNGRRGDAVEILAHYGVTHARLKVWVNPADGYNTKKRILPLAKRLKRAGIGIWVDFHYSDTWADPAHQTKPAAWDGLDTAGLTRAVHDHTTDVLGALRRQGTPADLVQVGNEINGGLLWPEGKNWGDGSGGWDTLAAFLKAGLQAARDTTPRVRTMLHIASGGDNATSRWWFDEAVSHGLDFDVIGQSYYPFWHGDLATAAANLADLSARYDKPVVIAETAYPFTLESEDATNDILSSESQLTEGFPATPQGQADWLRAVADLQANVPGGKGLGYCYWEGVWTYRPGDGWDPADPTSGNAWENLALFDFDDKALPALKVLGGYRS
ncbi:arabinogalactan endo-1,4-beta-galactosidase [Streptomyces sp. VRA16 Mangrove soil]|uniref:glycoside hydrolase family 53 protein n=1 Tax=Streptomyces sp. VRA16 Mangrove soil TaxID=2817434 RepID=UPI001A9E0E9F|nr:arabinogalactan endo-1,4-beta-galactosidase [Streptomyces sp. VRA16 Mangrove soil]MBO1337993.1 arabinogalactan endo-1,4-beta-galactosidase [Streptomyces sp. VRA16 Mangrove soil]